MAGNSVFAPRYAGAFASVAASAGLSVAEAQDQMKSFVGLLAESGELREVLENPSIPSDQKLGVLDALAERLGFMREVRNFLAVIMDHQRLGELSEIVDAYHAMADSSGGVSEAEVTTAHELNDADREELEGRVAKLAGSAVRVMYRLDPALLGGAVLRIGSTVYDGSVRAQLEQLKETLVGV